MSQPIAKQGDRVLGVDTHIILVPSPGGPVPTPTSMPFNGPLSQSLAPDVFVDNLAVAILGSKALNTPAHVPTGGPFQKQPSDQATVSSASSTVFADNKPVARARDSAACCNDPSDSDTGQIVAVSTVKSG
ncbi:MAG: PAAR domain-containing protein [Polyangiaceae bacterium]